MKLYIIMALMSLMMAFSSACSKRTVVVYDEHGNKVHKYHDHDFDDDDYARGYFDGYEDAD